MRLAFSLDFERATLHVSQQSFDDQPLQALALG
jgi:hypothetical protein